MKNQIIEYKLNVHEGSNNDRERFISFYSNGPISNLREESLVFCRLIIILDKYKYSVTKLRRIIKNNKNLKVCPKIIRDKKI